MSLRFLVDTDWVVHWLSGHEKIRHHLDEAKEQELAVSVISLAKLYEGIYNGRNRKAAAQGLRDFLTGTDLLSIDQATAEIFGRERGRLRAARKIIGDFDLMISTTGSRC